MNIVILTGNVGKDPEIKEFGGSKVCSFSLATTKKYKDKNGNQQTQTQWHRCKAWNKTAELIEKWVKKGDKLGINGEIQYSESEKDGIKTHYIDILVERIEFLGSSKTEQSTENKQSTVEKVKNAGVKTEKESFEPQEDDLPF